MRKKIDDDYSVEDYLKEELMEQQAPGLFSLSPVWFRHSNYELVNKGFDIYIRPAKGAAMEQYKPFEVFNEILGAFMSMVLKISDLEEENTDKEEEVVVVGPKDEEIKISDDRQAMENDYKKAEILLSFVKNYGPFGLFWEGIQYLYFTEIENKPNLTIFPKWPSSSIIEQLNEHSSQHLWGTSPISYDRYASAFFPGMSAPFPCLEFPRLGRPKRAETNENDFYNNYTEPVEHILRNSKFQLLSNHILIWTEFRRKGYKVDDYYPGYIEHVGYTEKELKRLKKLTWGDVLKLSFKGFGVSYSYEEEKGKWELIWKYNSLLEALAIMYLMNITGKMGGGVKVCALEGCNKPVVGHNRKYCSVKHGSANRVRRHRLNN